MVNSTVVQAVLTPSVSVGQVVERPTYPGRGAAVYNRLSAWNGRSPENAMASFELTLKTAASLHPGTTPARYVSVFDGVIRCRRGEKVTRVGRVRAMRLHADLAWRDGVSVRAVCRAHSVELHRLYAALFDHEEDDLCLTVRAQFDTAASDVLILQGIALHPRWRGLRLGLLALRRLLDLAGGGCGLAIAAFRPMTPDAAAALGVPPAWAPVAADQEAVRLARTRLRQHFARLGFERIPGTRLHGVAPARLVPAAELLRPGDPV